MDQSDQQGTEETTAAVSELRQRTTAQGEQQPVTGSTDPGDTGGDAPAEAVKAPVRAPRKRRTASAPAGAPPAAPVAAAPVTPASAPDVTTPSETSDLPAAPTSEAATPMAEATAPTTGVQDTPPARKRATRSRKPAVAAETAATTDLPATDAPAQAAADRPATVVSDPSDATDGAATATAPAVRATRTRRRAATAEAGPATPVEVTARPDALPETTTVDGDATPTIATATVIEPPVRATRSRRRAATAEAGPAAAAPPVAADTAPAAGPGATQGSAVGEDVALDAGTTLPDADSAPDEKPARTRRTASGRSRSRRASEPDQGDQDAAPAAASPGPEVTPTAGTVPAGDVPQDTDEDDAADTASDASAGTTTENRFDPFAVPESPLSLLFHAPDLTTVAVPSVKVTPPGDEEQDDDDSSDESGRRSRRSRRGRSRSRGDAGQPSSGESTDPTGPTEEQEDDADRADSSGPEDGRGVTSRRRRRRRRGDQDLELTGGEDDDPPNTVTRVRAPRQSSEAPPSDRVTSVRGSTRLEAKKQRRRESRDTGRRRQVITEAEFLARRESVDRQMIVRQRDDRIQIGVLEDGILGEHFVSRTQQDSLIGNVYLGKVQNVLPSMEAAFVDIGRGRNAVLYAGEVNWDAAGLDGQPRRIELALKSGDPVLVQVTKDPVGHKGARLTSQISLPGRYLVYVPGGSMTGISRKLPDVERNRLKRILKDRLPENAGVIVRTAAEGASEEELTHDINRLRAQWEEIERKAGSTKTLAPELLYGEPDLTIKVVRDVFNEDFSKLVVSGEEAWDTIEAYVMYVAPDLVGRLEKWTSDEDIFAASRIDEQIAKALERKVFLPSGGSLVIDRTEAMTVVDVNTGKFTGSGGNLEETVTKNNLEAAEEVVRQLRLRDIGGIIVIDFIDMVLEANRDLVLRRLVECLGRDRTKHQVAEVTSLGLVQMTRKRMGTGLLEVFGEDCEHCAGRGVVTHMEPVEHRHTSTADVQQQPRQERPSRSERKRSRGRGGQQDDFSPAPVVAPAAESPDRAAKAEAARAALASIAAATHHAHEEPSEEEAADADIQVTEAVLTINGETVTLPRADRRADIEEEAPAPATRLTLDSLSEAFNRRTTAGDAQQQSTDGQATAGSQPSGEAPTADAAPSGDVPRADSVPSGEDAAPELKPASRRPRRRVARSAQGAADTSIETQVSDGSASASGGSRHVAAARPAPIRQEGGTEPVIFGVGVSASEL